MYNACSTTARRGALDWAPIFEKANLPVFEKLYESVKNGTETRKSLEYNSRSTYRQDLAKELAEIDNQEIWRAGVIRVPTFSLASMLTLSFVLQARLSVHYGPTTSPTPSRFLLKLSGAKNTLWCICDSVLDFGMIFVYFYIPLIYLLLLNFIPLVRRLVRCSRE